MQLTRFASPLLAAWLLVAALLVLTASAAVDLTKELDLKSDLGFKLDFPLATYGAYLPEPKPNGDLPKLKKGQSSNFYAFSAHLRFNHPVKEISDGQLVQMLFNAADDMAVAIQSYGIGKKATPGAISVLAFEDEVILSTTVKGPGFTMEYSQTPVKELLKQCAAFWSSRWPADDEFKNQHANSAGCAEIGALHQYFLSRPYPHNDDAGAIENLQSIDPRPRITTILNKQGKWELELPCKSENPDRWGCDVTVLTANFNYLRGEIKPVPYTAVADLAGGLLPGFPQRITTLCHATK